MPPKKKRPGRTGQAAGARIEEALQLIPVVGKEAIARYMRISLSKLEKKHKRMMIESEALFVLNSRKGHCRYWAWAHRLDSYMAAYNRKVGPI